MAVLAPCLELRSETRASMPALLADTSLMATQWFSAARRRAMASPLDGVREEGNDDVGVGGGELGWETEDLHATAGAGDDSCSFTHGVMDG
jgi:hypothetical protein